MEEENKKNHPNLPSNYVTLLQLQERWIKAEKRKQEEIEKQKQKEKSDVVLDESEKSKSGGEKKKKKKKKKNNGMMKKKKEDKGEKEVKKEENENADVEAEMGKPRNRRERVKVVWKKVGDDVAEGSDRTVEIAEKLESVKVAEENDVARRDKSRYLRKNHASEGKSGGFHGRYGRRNGEFRGYNTDIGWNRRVNSHRRDVGNQMVWVKKEEFVGVKDEILS